jgi:hypothetical protein
MKRGRYIVSPAYDWTFFLAAPLAALALGIAVSGAGLGSDGAVGFLLGTVIHAHLVAVVFRSHGNGAIRRRYPIRFLVVPAVLWLAIVASPWIAVAATVVATFWDVWHSGAQTFGFARIYERNAGNPPELARSHDFWINQVFYFGPVLAGATLMDHLASFDNFGSIGDALFASVPAEVAGHRRYLTLGVLVAGGVVLAGYVLAHLRLVRAGYRPSWQKVWLVTTTGAVSIYTWGFNSWGQAFLIMNLFHGVQYLALVWAMEGRRIADRVGLGARPRVALALYLTSVLAYGLGVQALDASLTLLWAITIVVSLMHFWYDAFVWSVRRAEV